MLQARACLGGESVLVSWFGWVGTGLGRRGREGRGRARGLPTSLSLFGRCGRARRPGGREREVRPPRSRSTRPAPPRVFDGRVRKVRPRLRIRLAPVRHPFSLLSTSSPPMRGRFCLKCMSVGPGRQRPALASVPAGDIMAGDRSLRDGPGVAGRFASPTPSAFAARAGRECRVLSCCSHFSLSSLES